MNLSEIKQAVRKGKTVHWGSTAYVVTLFEKGGEEYWNIKCLWNNYCFGLTGANDTLECKEEDFFIAAA